MTTNPHCHTSPRSLAFDATKNELYYKRRTYDLMVSLPFELEVWIGTTRFITAKTAALSVIVAASQVTHGVNPTDLGGFVDPDIIVKKMLREIPDLIDYYKRNESVRVYYKPTFVGDFDAALQAVHAVEPSGASVTRLLPRVEARDFNWVRQETAEQEAGEQPRRILRLDFATEAACTKWVAAFRRRGDRAATRSSIQFLEDVYDAVGVWNADAYVRFKGGDDKMATTVTYSAPVKDMTQTLGTTFTVAARGGDDDAPITAAHGRSANAVHPGGMSVHAINMCNSPYEHPISGHMIGFWAGCAIYVMVAGGFSRNSRDS